MNPRHSTVAGNSGLKRRLVRRGLPYGPPYDPGNPDDGIERGLLGLFIGVSLKDQFEFLMSDWANKGSFAPGLRGTRDAIIGDNAAPDASFLIPREGQPTLQLSGLVAFRDDAVAAPTGSCPASRPYDTSATSRFARSPAGRLPNAPHLSWRPNLDSPSRQRAAIVQQILDFWPVPSSRTGTKPCLRRRLGEDRWTLC